MLVPQVVAEKTIADLVTAGESVVSKHLYSAALHLNKKKWIR